jgi:hydroxyethylthiazole kinase-like uncharacterized protein yjeF
MGTSILTCEEVRRCEALAVAGGLSMAELMRRAGEACAQALMRLFPTGRVLVLCGPGNNGGDALVAAATLREAGRSVEVFEGVARAGSAERAGAKALWGGSAKPLADLKLSPEDIVLDGLFGSGLGRPLAGELAIWVERVNASGARILAIDAPSGSFGDRGDLPGPVIRADATVTFGAFKPVHCLHPAAGTCGRVEIAEIGFGAFIPGVSGVPGASGTWMNAPDLWAERLPWPGASSHKHARGRLGVVSGGVASTGAARLAAGAGLRAGAGVVTLLCPPSALSVIASHLTAVMCASFSAPGALIGLTTGMTAIVIGPAAGVGAATRANVEALARSGRRLVLDADALTVFAGAAAELRGVLQADAVLTPHPGEFERLFPGLLTSSPNRIHAARAAAEASGAVVLLKGADTVIAHPDGRAAVNGHASPFLATAGSGDVLAGVIGGLMAQGMDAFTAACAGAWMHGEAGRRLGPGLTAEDLSPSLKDVLGDLYLRGTASSA